MTTDYPTLADHRAMIRAALDERRADRAAEALADLHAAERAAERAPLTLPAPSSVEALMGSTKAARKAVSDVAAARRRDEIRAMARPMTDHEIYRACVTAAMAAKVPPEHYFDVVQDLGEHILRKHGTGPLAADVGRAWLAQCAHAFHMRMIERTERATRGRAAARQLKEWGEQDADTGRAKVAADAAASGDPVAVMADRTEAPEPMEDLTIERICEALRGVLTPRQLSAVWLACADDHRDREALTSTERVQWMNARGRLRAAFPDKETLRLLYASDATLARRLVECCQREAARLAKVTTRGGGQCPVPRQPEVFPAAYRVPVSLPASVSTPIDRSEPQHGPAAVYGLARRHQSSPADVLSYIARHSESAPGWIARSTRRPAARPARPALTRIENPVGPLAGMLRGEFPTAAHGTAGDVLAWMARVERELTA
jgi:hypothetical protein